MSSTGMNQERCLTSEKLAFEQKNDSYMQISESEWRLLGDGLWEFKRAEIREGDYRKKEKKGKQTFLQSLI